MKIDEMEVKQSAVIVKINGEGQLRKRMLDLGLTRGVKIQLLRIAPLGDPIEIEVRGFALALRKSDARMIDLVPISEGD